MEPFSADLLTLLTVISISWTGITFIAVLIIGIIFLCKLCIKRRRSNFVKPIRTPSTVSVVNPSPPTTPVLIRTVDQHKRTVQAQHDYDTDSILDEHSYSNHKNKYQQQEYMRNDNDETTRTKNESRTYVPRQQKRQYQSVKPLANLRVTDRHTPYPADVLAREKLMNYTRFSMEDKY